MKIYLAAPLFTQAERRWNLQVAYELEQRGYRVSLPQVSVRQLIGPDGTFEPRALFHALTRDLHDADVVVAVLDGPDVDSGTSWECGFAFALGKPVVALRTDIRRGGDTSTNVNLVLAESADSIIHWPAFQQDVKPLADLLAEHILRASAKRDGHNDPPSIPPPSPR